MSFRLVPNHDDHFLAIARFSRFMVLIG